MTQNSHCLALFRAAYAEFRASVKSPAPKASVSAQRLSAEALFDLPPVQGFATRLLMNKRNARQQLAGGFDGQRTELNKPSALFPFGREGHAHGALNPA